MNDNVINERMADWYDPPSASMDPDASTGGGMNDLDAIEQKWLGICGACDVGVGMCTHPSEDYRPVMADLVNALRHLGKPLPIRRCGQLSVHAPHHPDRDHLREVQGLPTRREGTHRMSEPAEILRAAAVRVREVAKAATEGPWDVQTRHVYMGGQVQSRIAPLGKPQVVDGHFGTAADPQHIALWHPGVALAVADWLESAADELDAVNAALADDWASWTAALAVARALLLPETET